MSRSGSLVASILLIAFAALPLLSNHAKGAPHSLSILVGEGPAPAGAFVNASCVVAGLIGLPGNPLEKFFSAQVSSINKVGR
jgi:hypothetical protein